MAILDNIKAAWSFDESTGNAADSSGNNFTLTNTGVTYGSTSPLVNNYAEWNASGDILRSTTLAAWQPTNFTINVWVYRATDAAAGTQGLFCFGNNDLQVTVVGSADTTNKNKVKILNYGGSDSLSASTIPNNAWTMITIDHTADGAFHIYFNAGSADLTTGAETTTWEAGGNNFTVGNQCNETNQPFIGKMDIFTGWDRVLTSAERTLLYNGGGGLQYPFIHFSPFPSHYNS